MTVARVTSAGVEVIRNADTTVRHARVTTGGVEVMRNADTTIRFVRATSFGVEVLQSVAQRVPARGGSILLHGL